MNLAENLRLQSPVIWVASSEPERTVDCILALSQRQVYRMDAFDGLITWKDNDWKQVLVEKHDPEKGIQEVVTYSLPVALQHVFKETGLFILDFGSDIVKEIMPLLAGLSQRYRRSFYKNNDQLPTQLLLISHDTDVPPALHPYTSIVTEEIIDEKSITEIVSYIQSNLDIPEDKVANPAIVARGALGLPEAELVNAVMTSIIRNGFIDPTWIAKHRLDLIKQGGMLEIVRPKLGLDDIGGLDNAKKLIEWAVFTWSHPEEMEKMRLEPLRRILLVGVPGTGKSAICEATAKSLDLDLVKFGVSKMLGKFVGESESNMRQAFRQIKAMAPVCTWIDELGRDLSIGNWQGDGGTTSRVHGEFLTGIQELPNNVFLMAAANNIDGLSPEMLRADRFDKILFVGFPAYEELVEIFRIHLHEDAPNFDLEALAAAAESFTGAEVRALIREARVTVASHDRRAITTNDLLALIPTQKNRMWLKHAPVVQQMYERALEDWDWASSEQLKMANAVLSGTLASQTKFYAPGAPKSTKITHSF